MIKIVKVNKLYLNSLLVSIVSPCVPKRNDEISMRVKIPMCETGMVTYITKRRPFVFSKVVQRYSGDKVIR